MTFILNFILQWFIMKLSYLVLAIKSYTQLKTIQDIKLQILNTQLLHFSEDSFPGELRFIVKDLKTILYFANSEASTDEDESNVIKDLEKISSRVLEIELCNT